MPLLSLDAQSPIYLIDQIVTGLQQLIDEHAIRRGTRLPSIRKFAEEHGVSRFTVVQAFDRLVATGHLQSRPGSGFYVAARPMLAHADEPPIKLERAMDVLWLLRNALQHTSSTPVPGAGWLPNTWLDQQAIQRNLRALSRKHGEFLTRYGDPAGYVPLRQLLQKRLTDIGVMADTSQLILTQGATHAIDLVARYFIRPGDTVLVDDPGYFILFGALKSFGAKVIGVPWTSDGPDTAVMETLINEHQPTLFCTNSILHNPTGASIHQATAHRILQLAEKHGIFILEDDVYGEFNPTNQTRLATLDQLNRVIYIGGFSKTISASVRVGYIACKRELADQLTDLKLLSGLTTSELSERLIHQLLTDGYYRKYLDKLKARLQRERERTIENLERIGFKLYLEPRGGMFVWVEAPNYINVIELANSAARQGITLAPGNLFRPYQEPTPHLRFNVASSNEPDTLAFLERALAKQR